MGKQKTREEDPEKTDKVIEMNYLIKMLTAI
jgi:hypothetical protein